MLDLKVLQEARACDLLREAQRERLARSIRRQRAQRLWLKIVNFIVTTLG
jgi:hypothetical protein